VHSALLLDTDCVLACVCCTDGEPPTDDRRMPRRSGAEDREPAESRRRTADSDDTVLESHEQSSVASQDQGSNTHTHTRLTAHCPGLPG